MGLSTTLERILSAPEVASAEHPFKGLLRDQGIALGELVGLPAPYGGFFPIGVGHGKTGISELAPDIMGAERALLLIPPDMVETHARERKWLQARFDYTPPTVLTYNQLSNKNASALLEKFRPDLIIADECHLLQHQTSSRTKRIIRYFQEHPDCRFIGMSGTITTKSVKQFSHLLELALRDRSPLPYDWHALNDWAAVLDAGAEPSQSQLANLQPLLDWACETNPNRAFLKRLASLPGVHYTASSSIDANILITRLMTTIPAKLQAAMTEVKATWCTPDGDEFEDAISLMRYMRTLSVGFFYRWVWPGGVVDEEWLDARRAWHRAVRKALAYSSQEGHDSPALIADACKEGKGPHDRVRAWRGWCAVKHRPVPPREAVWVDKAILERIVAYTKALGHPVLIWYSSVAVGDALSEMGVAVYGAATDPPRTGGIIAVSIPAHHKGKQFQHWADQIIIEPPSSGATMQQLLGRTHRTGQQADDIHVRICQYSWPQRKALSNATVQAYYMKDTSGEDQKILLAQFISDKNIDTFAKKA